MASRAFSFDIPKPATGVDTTALQQNLFFDLRDKYPTESGVDSDQIYTDIITEMYPTGFSSREIKFDRGFSRETRQRIITNDFGDGYSQRVKDGINTKLESYNMNLANRLWQEIALIASYFDVVQPGSFDIRLERETVKVNLESYRVLVGHDSVQSISAQLRRVYI